MTSLIPPGRVGAIISSMTSQMRTPEGGTVTPLMPGPHTQGLESLEGKGEGGQGHRDAMKAGLWRQSVGPASDAKPWPFRGLQ